MPMTVRTSNHDDTTRSHSIGTMENFFRGGESSKKSPSYSPTSSLSPLSPYLKQNDLEEDHGLYHKKSVLTKVKERARRLRFSLSKRRQEDENHTPSWGVTLQDEEEDPDAEYLGAPMYESEVAPEIYKENARQHPRANPVISEKHVLHTNVREEVMMEQQDQQNKPLSPDKYPTTTTIQPLTTRNEKVSEKLIPAYAEGSSDNDAATSVSSKILQGHVAVSRTPSANDYPLASPPSSAPLTSSSIPVSVSAKSSSISPKQGGASVKEYLKIKFEPGSDEKALSEVISEAMSPRKTTTTHNNNSSAGNVIEKVRVAVNSLLRNEEPSSPQQCGLKTNAQEVGHEGMENSSGKLILLK